MILDWKIKIFAREWVRISHDGINLISISPCEGLHLWEHSNNSSREIKDGKLIISGVDEIGY